jgi:hypothetical protein
MLPTNVQKRPSAPPAASAAPSNSAGASPDTAKRRQTLLTVPNNFPIKRKVTEPSVAASHRFKVSEEMLTHMKLTDGILQRNVNIGHLDFARKKADEFLIESVSNLTSALTERKKEKKIHAELLVRSEAEIEKLPPASEQKIKCVQLRDQLHQKYLQYFKEMDAEILDASGLVNFWDKEREKLSKLQPQP